MSDSLVDAVQRARTWPAGSGARQTLTNAARQLMKKREQEISEMEDLLARQWTWLEDHGAPGEDDTDENSARYEDGMKRYLMTLANYEDLVDGLHQARADLDAMSAMARAA